MKNLKDKTSPLVSIITVVFNAVKDIEKTLQSVLSQSYNNIEYIVIDGGSTDGTVDIIRKYSDRIDYWISESDNGIYDAMNKGVNIAHGEWINFMNCGDLFADNIIVEYLMKYIYTKECDVLYGDVILKRNKVLKRKKALDMESIKYSLPFCHQSSFVKLSILKKCPFNLSFSLAADYEFFYRLYYKTNCKFLYVDKVIAVYESTFGISSVNRRKTYDEICLINGRNLTILGRLRFYIISLLLYVKVFR